MIPTQEQLAEIKARVDTLTNSVAVNTTAGLDLAAKQQALTDATGAAAAADKAKQDADTSTVDAEQALMTYIDGLFQSVATDL